MSTTPRTDAATDFTAPEHLHRLATEMELELTTLRSQLAASEANAEYLTQQRTELWREIAMAKHSDLGYAALCEDRDKHLARAELSEAREQILRAALENWQRVWNHTECEMDDCLPASRQAEEALALPAPPSASGLVEALEKIEFYGSTGILQDSFDEIKRIARAALAAFNGGKGV